MRVLVYVGEAHRGHVGRCVMLYQASTVASNAALLELLGERPRANSCEYTPLEKYTAVVCRSRT